MPWAPRSPDLTPLDYFLWGYVKDRVYGQKPATMSDLKSLIAEAIRSVTTATVSKVYGNFEKQLAACIEQHGGHFERGLSCKC